MQKLENKLAVLREKGRQDVFLEMSKGKTHRVREAGQRFVSFFKGTSDKVEEDIDSAKKALILAQEHLKRLEVKRNTTVVQGQIDLLKGAIKNLSWYVERASDFTRDEKEEIDRLTMTIFKQYSQKLK